MPHLSVSAEVFARIWSLRQPGEDSEDAILRRQLGIPAAPSAKPAPEPAPQGGDFVDSTYGIRFPEGFEIFRTYKGRDYTARVEAGRWRLVTDGHAYASLNRLSQAVIDGNENAWVFWFFRGADGERTRIAELRDPARVQKRPRRARAKAASVIAPAAAPAGAGKPWEPPRAGG